MTRARSSSTSDKRRAFRDPAGVRHARCTFESGVPQFDKLLLATRAVSPIGSAVDGFNGKIDSPVFFDRALAAEECAALHANARESAQLAWNFAENFRSQDIREIGRTRAERRRPQWRRARGDRPQLDGTGGLVRRRPGAIRRDLLPLGRDPRCGVEVQSVLRTPKGAQERRLCGAPRGRGRRGPLPSVRSRQGRGRRGLIRRAD